MRTYEIINKRNSRNTCLFPIMNAFPIKSRLYFAFRVVRYNKPKKSRLVHLSRPCRMNGPMSSWQGFIADSHCNECQLQKMTSLYFAVGCVTKKQENRPGQEVYGDGSLSECPNVGVTNKILTVSGSLEFCGIQCVNKKQERRLMQEVVEYSS